MKQAQVFLDSEGDRWFERNAAKLGKHDPVSAAIEHLRIKPENVLEIGSSNGWRLAALRDKYGCSVMGLDPSHAASEDAKKRKVSVQTATAAAMPLRSHAYDLVIYGFCLYLTDPEDWFRIAMEGDRVLADGGYLIVHDFDLTNARPFARRYEHCPDVLSYHVDFAQLWLAHPWYHRIEYLVAGHERVTLLRKNVTASIPVTL
jgi:ubiquinone/menaquinone biosynthesis C-methylase UbiE